MNGKNGKSALWTVLALASAWAVGCGEEFDPASLVNDLRVLAIRATPPDIPLAGSAVLEPLVNVPGGGTASYKWSICLVGVDTARGFECLDPAFECDLGTEATATVVPLTLLTDCLANAQPSEELAKKLGADAGSFDPEAFFTEKRTVVVKLNLTAGGTSVDAIKRLTLGGTEEFNANPAIAIVEVASAAWGLDEVLVVAPNQEVEIRLDVTEASRETYVVQEEDGTERTETEEILYAFFASEGEMGGNFANDDLRAQSWVAPELNSGEGQRDVQFWFVARDGRGGTDWTLRALRVVAPPAAPEGQP